MRIAIMGAGGVGAYVGARLQAAGEHVAYVARGAHLRALQNSGLFIESPNAPLHLPSVRASDDPAQIGPVDLVLFAVKLWDTEAAARSLAPLIGPNTRVVTLQNGIDSVELISQHVPRSQLRGGVIYVSAVIDRPGVIKSPGGFHRIVVDAAQGDPVIADFCAACGRATALEAAATDAIDTAIWEKFIALSSVAASTSLMRAPMGLIRANADSLHFQRQLIEEGVAIASAAGKRVRSDMTDSVLATIAGMPPSFRSSMAEDLARGKPLELRWLSGRLHGLGQHFGVATPAHSAVFRALALYEHGAPA